MINDIPPEVLIHIALFLSVYDLFKHLRLCCTQFKKMIQKNQLIFIQHKKALPCLNQKHVQICQKLSQMPRVHRHDTIQLCIGSKFVNHIGGELRNWLTNQLQQQQQPLVLYFEDFNFKEDVQHVEFIQTLHINKLIIGWCELNNIPQRGCVECCRGILTIIGNQTHYETLKMLELNWKFESNDTTTQELIYNDLLSFRDPIWISKINVKEFSFQKSPVSFFYWSLDRFNLKNINSLCWDTRNFEELGLNQSKIASELINLQEFVFVDVENISALNTTLVKINVSSLKKIGCHIIEWNDNLNQYVQLFNLCPKLETVQISTKCAYDKTIINWIKNILKSISSSSQERNVNKFGLILGVSFDAHGEVHSTLEAALEENMNLWTTEMTAITVNYCILGEINHLQSELDGVQARMKICSTADYNVYDDDGVIITEPSDICVKWLMVISKKISPEIKIGDFRISNNFTFQHQPTADYWSRPST